MDALLRAYEARDAEAAAAFFTDAARLDDALEPTSLPQWRAFAGASFNRGARDFVVAESEGRIVGMLTSTMLEEEGMQLRNARVVVHPQHRRRGIGGALIEVADAQAAEEGIPVQASCPASWTIGAGILERRGFEACSEDLWMDLGQAAWARAPAAEPPAGVTIRYYDTSVDDASWMRLNDEGYRGGPHYAPLTPDDLWGFRGEPGFGLWFALEDGRHLGLCHAKDFGLLPCINSLVVTPAARGRGIGRALMHRALTELAGRGTWPVRLTVLADNAPARQIYQGLGFRTVETITLWRRGRPA